MAHEYVLYVTFVVSKIVVLHPKRDASKNVPTPTVSEFYEILRASYISRDVSNGEICFFIQDLENKFRIFDRNYDFTLFPKIGIFGSYTTEFFGLHCGSLTPVQNLFG